MIKLTRPPKPDILSSPIVQQLKENLLELFNAGNQGRMKFESRYFLEVRPVLAGMSKQKCAYCESAVGKVSNIEIDHYRPRSGARGIDNVYHPDHYFWLAYEWENLLPSCQICSRQKMNLFPLKYDDKRAQIGSTGATLLLEEPLLLDPCFDEPSEHFTFKADGMVQALTERGSVTIEVLKLNRELLRYARRDAIVSFRLKLETGKFSDTEILDLLSPDTEMEHAGALRTAYQSWKKDVLSPAESAPAKVVTIGKAFNIVANVPVFEEVRRFSLKKIEIKNFRSIRSLTLEIPEADPAQDQESWLLLLGDNGVGKSSILQAIAMALCGQKQFKKLKVQASDYLRNGTKSGYVKVWSYEDAQPVVLEFDEREFKGGLNQPASYLIGYGATRLLPRGGFKSSAQIDPRVNISNLFDYSSALNELNSWLVGLTEEDFQKRVAPALFDLLDLRPGERVLRSKKGRLQVQYASGLRDIEKTSDGYISIVALACDMIKTLSGYPGGFHMANAIVLIDEIGNHLHPRWRMKINYALRNAFPKIQFVVSTHEPLCLRGLLQKEVMVLAADQNRQVFKIDAELLPDHTLMRVDELLTSDYFGLINLFDPETQKSFEQYYQLLSIPKFQRTEADKDKIALFSRFFAGKEMVGSTPRVQAVYEIVNEIYAKRLLENDFKTKLQLKQETIEEVRKMFDLGNLNWL